MDEELKEFADGMRINYRKRTASAGAPDPVAGIRTAHIPAQDPERNIQARLYLPIDMAGYHLPVVLFAHGGGFVAGDLDTHDVLARAIANKTGALVLSVDYRLAPEHPYPAGLEDVYAALVWAALHAPEFGGDPDRIAVCGDSAGGNLVAATAILARDRAGPGICAQWLMYPALDNKMDTRSWNEFGKENFPTRELNSKLIAAYVPRGIDANGPLVAPRWARLDKLPPALVQSGEFDPLRDEGVAYAEGLRNAGVDATSLVYTGQQHGFIQYFKDAEHNREGAKALEEGAAFLRSKLKVAKSSPHT